MIETAPDEALGEVWRLVFQFPEDSDWEIDFPGVKQTEFFLHGGDATAQKLAIMEWGGEILSLKKLILKEPEADDGH